MGRQVKGKDKIKGKSGSSHKGAIPDRFKHLQSQNQYWRLRNWNLHQYLDRSSA